MADSSIAAHEPSHQFVKSGNVFGADAADRGITAQIKIVQYGGVRFGTGGADDDGVLRIATEHGELQLKTGSGAQGFPGDFRFVLRVQGDVNEFLSDESLDLIEHFEFTVQYAQDHVAKAQFSVNLIDVVYSGEHFLSEGLSAHEVLPSGLLEPAAPDRAAVEEAPADRLEGSTSPVRELALGTGDLLPENLHGTLDLDRYFGGEIEPGAANHGGSDDAKIAHLTAGLETRGLDDLPAGDLPPVDG